MNIKKYKKECLILTLLLIGLSVIWYQRNISSLGAEWIEIKAPSNQQTSQRIYQKQTVKYITVHITGAVRFPGLYEMQAGSGVKDVIDIAGGLLSGADLGRINLAKRLKNGSKLSIPFASKLHPNKQRGVTVVNINTSDSKTLQKIKGVGPKMAKKIVDYRNKHGRFRQAKDLEKVSGLGPKKVKKMVSYITF